MVSSLCQRTLSASFWMNRFHRLEPAQMSCVRMKMRLRLQNFFHTEWSFNIVLYATTMHENELIMIFKISRERRRNIKTGKKKWSWKWDPWELVTQLYDLQDRLGDFYVVLNDHCLNTEEKMNAVSKLWKRPKGKSEDIAKGWFIEVWTDIFRA